MTYEIRHNHQFCSSEVYFDGKPSEAVREALKQLKMRWHSVKRCWYGYASEETIAAAITGTTTEEEPASVVADGYLGGGAVYGSKSHKYLHGSALSAAIREDLKKAGIKATVKVHSYAGGQSITVTYKTTPADYIPFAQYLEAYRVSCSGWITFGSGASEFIHADKYFSLDDAEQQRIREAAALFAYTKATTQESRSRHADHLTTETNAIIARIDAIVTAYRYDCSNSMVDYFDTNFYYDIVLKPVAA
jgi:hypothetical protein